ncbi:MAG: cytochrome c oxidase accessory protein CcoG [Devosia sp.]|nr:cytochrome c oxidase accessory protein CcoG [Devosia sp.]
MLDTDIGDVPQRHDVEPVNAKGRRQPLYAPRKKIFPKRASGNFRKYKWLVMAITLTIYYLGPWMRWNRGPFAPDQAILVDLASRRFYFLFIEIWPQEFYYVAGMLVMAGVGLFLVTSTIGRAWCGYTCPQTVWVDLFLVVERAIEGDRNARMKLDSAPWTADKVVKRMSKHAIWLLIGIATGGAWIFYFADAPTLLSQVVTFQAPVVAYGTIALLTATTYTLGGLLREQVCTYMCPWPRIQAAMLDENSLTVTYNDWRGEPRSRHAKRVITEGKPAGDCVDCNACVVVCPMGIDIREGQQLECITCALCIDACDNVMDKLGKERGLISYATLNDYNANMALAGASATTSIDPSRVRNPSTGKLVEAVQHTTWRSIVRPRTLIYFLVWIAIGLVMLTVLSMRAPLEVNVLHDRNPQFVRLSDGSIRNGYTLKILNMTPAPRDVTVSLVGLEGAQMTQADSADQPVNALSFSLQPDKVLEARIFVRLPRAAATTKLFDFDIVSSDGKIHATAGGKFETPEGNAQ